MGRTKGQWIDLGKKRILSILEQYRISYSKHLEIKISEAGPYNQRVEPVLLNDALAALQLEKGIQVLTTSPIKIFGDLNYGRPGDPARFKAFQDWYNLYLQCSQHEHLCGLMLERLIYQAVLHSGKYHVLGTGPLYTDDGTLFKPKGAEQLFLSGKAIYGADSGNGLDLLLIHKETNIPIGIEAKNIREWQYPASSNIWRLIARACTLECLPVFAARKISYLSRAGLFHHVGIMGFETQFQYFHPKVKAFSKYRFEERVIDKTRLGFADIKIPKRDETPNHFNQFIGKILPDNVEEYYSRFMHYLPLLKKYAIDHQLAEDKVKYPLRLKLYQQFQEEAGFTDPNIPDEGADN